MVRIAPWARATAPLDVIVVRTILLNSSMKVAVFSSMNGTAT